MLGRLASIFAVIALYSMSSGSLIFAQELPSTCVANIPQVGCDTPSPHATIKGLFGGGGTSNDEYGATNPGDAVMGVGGTPAGPQPQGGHDVIGADPQLPGLQTIVEDTPFGFCPPPCRR